jgi:membrane protease YdiL (CAAX protease family)
MLNRTVFRDDQDRVRDIWRVLGGMFAAWVLEISARVLYGMVPRACRSPMADEWIEWLAVLLAAWLCLRLEGESLASLGFGFDGRWFRELGLGVLAGGGIIGATALIVLALGGFHWIRTPGAGLGPVLRGGVLYLAVALAEETYYRGYPFQRLVRGTGVVAAQVLFALYFAHDHWGNPGMHGATLAWATLNIGLAAILLGLAWIRTGSLALPIGLHLGWNWIQGSLLGFGVSGLTDTPGAWTPVFHGRPAWLTGGAFGLEASLPCALVCGAAILILARWEGRMKAPPES